MRNSTKFTRSRLSGLPRKTLTVATMSAVLALALAGPAGAAATAAPDTSVKSLVVTSGDSTEHATLSLTFANGISQAAAAKIRSQFAGPVRPDYGVDMWCWGSLNVPDGNGDFSIQYNCGSPRTLPWGYQISSAVQSIIVSPVSETGLRWWRNSYLAGQNAPHTVPANYNFHGTMNPVWATDNVSYQDYMTFRHDLGGGGTGSITFAGGVNLQN